MLRKRSRGVSTKQGLMADQSPLSSPNVGYNKPTSSFFSSPKLFTGFSAKGFSDSESVMSPTSILDSKPFFSIGNPFWLDRSPKSPQACIEKKHPWEKSDSRYVGLGIVDSLIDGNKDNKLSKPEGRMVLFGSQLKIQIPPLPRSSISPTPSPQSSLDFGSNTLNSLSGSLSHDLSPSSAKKTLLGSTDFGCQMAISPQVFTGCLSASEIELSEDYTCVISHGPNPKTTHIFDNVIIESCGVGFPGSWKEENCFFNDLPSYPSDNFLSFCYLCKKNLGQGKDIYMYRGEKAFCSHECRAQEMLFDEGVERCMSGSSAENYGDVFDAIQDCS
ncbi:FCS-Like Zinc finger 8-like [Tasmannia lanceolata]|uniref:FCS-Like Zinc finger 8-like n=1 Tax=Tasmannia lanceolata TaxID=3420 RepID=UPI004064C7A0